MQNASNAIREIVFAFPAVDHVSPLLLQPRSHAKARLNDPKSW
jgi:hypothetical protein